MVVWATSKLYSTSDPSWQTSGILCTTLREVAIHTMDYIDVATTGVLSPHILPIEVLREMLSHIEETLPSTMHLPFSSEDAVHFYRYLHTHILIADEQFLLLINVPIQDHAQQLEIYEVFNLARSHGNFSAHYNIQNRYLGLTYDETSTVEISRRSIQNMPEGQWTILQFKHTASTTCQSTNFCIQPYMPRTRTASRKDVHYRSGKPTA